MAAVEPALWCLKVSDISTSVMSYGICTLSVIPVRAEPTDASEMVNQLLFGEVYEVLIQRNDWLRIRSAHDQYEGWISEKQWSIIDKQTFSEAAKHTCFAADLVDMIRFERSEAHALICFGSPLPLYKDKKGRIGESAYQYSGDVLKPTRDREIILSSAYTYLHSPYLWGGRTPFGIDCSGLTQMAYRFGGIDLPRDAWQQAELGNPLSFIEESEPGDLAFFANKEGKIVHVGLLLEDNRILHASGQVRIDPIDQTGIYHMGLKRHTHRLRVIKRLL